MPKYLNTNTHVVYVDDPADETRDLTQVFSSHTIDASGAFADNLEQTPGVFRVGSDEAKAFKRGVKVKGDTQRKYPPNAEEVLATDGEHSFPASEQEIVDVSDASEEQLPASVADHEQEQEQRQEVAEAPEEGPKVNYASDEAGERADELNLNPRDLEDRTGSGKDGALTVSDIKEIAAELSSTPESLDDASEEQLTEMASEFGINTDELLEDVEDEERRETLQAAVEEAAGDTSTASETDTGSTTETNEPSEGGTVTSDQVPKAS